MSSLASNSNEKDEFTPSPPTMILAQRSAENGDVSDEMEEFSDNDVDDDKQERLLLTQLSQIREKEKKMSSSDNNSKHQKHNNQCLQIKSNSLSSSTNTITDVANLNHQKKIPNKDNNDNNQNNSATKTKTKKQASDRGKNYHYPETMFLLNTIDKILPLSPLAWERVVEIHNKKFPYKERTMSSIKTKFKNLRTARPPTGDPHCPEDVQLAKRIQVKIGQKSDMCNGDVKVDSLNGFDIGTEEEDVVVVTNEGEKEGEDDVDNKTTINNTTKNISDSVNNDDDNKKPYIVSGKEITQVAKKRLKTAASVTNNDSTTEEAPFLKYLIQRDKLEEMQLNKLSFMFNQEIEDRRREEKDRRMLEQMEKRLMESKKESERLAKTVNALLDCLRESGPN